MSKKTLIIIASAIIVTLTAAAFLFLFLLTPNETTKLSKSTTGDMIQAVTTVNGVAPGSVSVAPATEKWWNAFLKFNSNETVADVNFGDISVNATYVAYTLSPGGQYQDFNAVGLPTTFIVYETADDARVAGEAVGTTVSHFVRGNMLLFIPEGAYTDIDYSLEQYINSEATIEASDLALNDQAIMQINFKSLQAILMSGVDEADERVYETSLALLGVTKESGWVGYSDDGLTWDGKFYKVNTKSVNKPSVIDVYLNDQLYFLNTNGEEQPISEATEGNQSGIMVPRQSRAIEYIALSNNEETAGTYLTEDGVAATKGKVLAEDEGLYNVEMNPNEWIGIMRGQDVLYPITQFSIVSITITDTDGSSRIVLTPTP